MGAPALQAAGAALGGRDARAAARSPPRALALLGLLMLIVAPLALLSSTGGSPQITQRRRTDPAGLVPVFNEAARVYAVNAYLLASIADQESTFGTGPGWRTVNSAGCVGLMQMCVGGAGGDSWDATKYAYRRGQRPASYSFMTDRHPDVLDSFDNVMAAAVHLRGKVGGRPIPRLDGLAYQALCGYYGACSDGIAGNYAADVLARARTWEREAAASPSPSTPALGADRRRSPGRCAGRSRRRSASAGAWEACHPGVDIGVAERHADPRRRSRTRLGRPDRPAQSGGYGNFTCLQHTGALSTCYAHQQRFLVHVGETRRARAADRDLRLHRPLLRPAPALRGPPRRPARLPGAPTSASPRARCAPRDRPAHEPASRSVSLVARALAVALAGCQDPYSSDRARPARTARRAPDDAG